MKQYIVALMPLFSRVALIALITLTHSVSWVNQASNPIAEREGIKTAQRETVTIPVYRRQPGTAESDSHNQFIPALNDYFHNIPQTSRHAPAHFPLFRSTIASH